MNLKGIDKKTWTRMTVLALVLANQVSVSVFSFELLPFDQEALNEKVSTVITIVATVWAAWKNNPVSKEAQQAQADLEAAKQKKKRKKQQGK